MRQNTQFNYEYVDKGRIFSRKTISKNAIQLKEKVSNSEILQGMNGAISNSEVAQTIERDIYLQALKFKHSLAIIAAEYVKEEFDVETATTDALESII